jgi:hypothetical protein
MIENEKNIFFYWDEGYDKLPSIHKMNVDHVKRMMAPRGWKVLVTSLLKGSTCHVENYISLPDYFYNIKDMVSDLSAIPGNHSDIIRLRLLEKYGGVYFDVSTILLKHIEDIALYQKLVKSNLATLSGYTNFTFTRKTSNNENYFEEAKDGMELNILYAKKGSHFLYIFNQEIDNYWAWKNININKNYKDYPPFVKHKLTDVSFLNEYHIHYSIYHLLITRDPDLLTQLRTQSMHMSGKENAVTDGPYSPIDRFCRGESGYEKADPKKLLAAFVSGNIRMFNKEGTNLEDRIKFFTKADLLVIPGYLRVDLAKKFKDEQSYILHESAYKVFYRIAGFKDSGLLYEQQFN